MDYKLFSPRSFTIMFGYVGLTGPSFKPPHKNFLLGSQQFPWPCRIGVRGNVPPVPPPMATRLQIYHCMQLNALFCCLWRNVETSCHKHFVIFSRNQHRRLLPAMSHNLRAVVMVHLRPCLQHLACCSVKSRQWSQIQAQNRNFCLPHLHSMPPLRGCPSEYRHDIWYGETRMVWLPDAEKILKIC